MLVPYTESSGTENEEYNILIHFSDSKNRVPFRNNLFPYQELKKLKASNTCIRLILQTSYKLLYVHNTVFSLWLYRESIHR